MISGAPLPRQPLHFLFATTFFPPYSFGGDGIAVDRWARALVRLGHRVTVIHNVDAYLALGGRDPASSVALPEGLVTVPLRTRFPKLSVLAVQQTGSSGPYRDQLLPRLTAPDVDVIQFHNVSLLGAPAVLRMGSALKLHMAHDHWLVCESHVLWRHGVEACPARECLRCVLHHHRPPQIWRRTRALPRALERIQAFIALSQFSGDKHRELGFEADMEVVSNFLPRREVAADGPAPSRDRPYFLIAGRLERIKGLDRVIPLFLDDFGSDLVLAGEGSERGALEALAQGRPQIQFVGRLSESELAPWFRGARGVIVPSVGFETFGMTIIEAMLAGAPVIARRLGPAPEILESGGAGLLFDTETELRAHLVALTRTPELAAEFRRKGTERFDRQYTEAAVIPRYLEIVRRAALRFGHSRVADALAPHSS